MEHGRRDVVLEYSEYVDRPATLVWEAVRQVQGSVLPQGIIEDAPTHTPDDGSPVQVVRASAHVSMEQRVLEIDDALMLLRMEMTSGQNVPWSTYGSRLRVEPVDGSMTRVTVSCLATPTVEPRLVEGMLRGLIVLSLQSLKRQMEAS